MSILRYAGISFDIMQTLELNQRACTTEDRQDYRDSEFTIDIVGVINPRAMSYSFGNSSRDVLAEATHTSIRHQLMQNRQELIYTLGASIPLNPIQGVSGTILAVVAQNDVTGTSFICDNRGGPYPQYFDIIEVQGPTTLIVRFRVQTYLNECGSRPGMDVGKGRSVILTNRWSRWIDTDDNHYAVTVTEGTVYFRMDELLRRRTAPDEFRETFGFTYPSFQAKNWRRERIIVKPTTDGAGINYRFVDREVPISIGVKSLATKIELIETTSLSMAKGANLLAKVREITKSAKPKPGSTGLRSFVPDWEWGGKGLGDVIRTAIVGSFINKVSYTITAKVTGDINSRRSYLGFIGAAAVLGRALRRAYFATAQFVTSANLMQKYVEVSGTFVGDSNLNVAGSAINLVAGFFADEEVIGMNVEDFARWLSLFGDPNNVLQQAFNNFLAAYPPTLSSGPLMVIASDGNQGTPKLDIEDHAGGDIGNPQFPNADGNMGTYQAAMVAAALMNPCSKPVMRQGVALPGLQDETYFGPAFQGDPA